MESRVTEKFWKAFDKLPFFIQDSAKKSFSLWKQNPFHPSLEFKAINIQKQIFSVRIGMSWRALGLKEENIIIWFWIGSHSDYDQLLNSF